MTAFNRYFMLLILSLVSLATAIQTYGAGETPPFPKYTTVDLGDFEPIAINNVGNAIGAIRDTQTNAVKYAFWKQGETFEIKGLSGEMIQLRDINDLDQVVGGDYKLFEDGAKKFHAFLWENGATTDLHPTELEDKFNLYLNDPDYIVKTDVAMHNSSDAWGINNQGAIVGYSLGQFTEPFYELLFTDITNDNKEVKHISINLQTLMGAMWQNGEQHVVGYPMKQDENNVYPFYFYPYWYPTSINDLGDVTGRMFFGRGAPPTDWTLLNQKYAFVVRNGSISILKGPDGEESEGVKINNSGYVLGHYDSSLGEGYRVCYWYDGRCVSLHQSSWLTEYAYDINDATPSPQIVGFAMDQEATNMFAFLAQNDTVINLNELIDADSGWYLETAQSINDQGWIAGSGIYQNQRRGFLLKPESGPIFKIDNKGNVFADGTYQTPAADFAERWLVSSSIDPTELSAGHVLSLNSDGGVQLAHARESIAILGIYASKPGLLAGSPKLPTKSNRGAVYVPVAMTGIVPAKACCENGPIIPGDLLSISREKPGYLAKSVPQTLGELDFHPVGSIVGKALAPLTEEEGLIRILLIMP